MSRDQSELTVVMDEMKRSVAYLFRAKGNRLKKNDFIYEPSLELGWFDPPKGRVFFNNLLALGLIKTEDDSYYSLDFDRDELSVPMDFKPRLELILPEPDPELLSFAEELHQAPRPPAARAPPSAQEQGASPTSLLDRIVGELVERTGSSREELQEEMDAFKADFPLLEPAVRALLLAQKKGSLGNLKRELVDEVFRGLVDAQSS